MKDVDAALQWLDGQLVFYPDHNDLKKKLVVDFLDPKLQQRIQWKNLKKELIVKACCFEKGLKICDATAGLGVDSFLLAAAGAAVTSCERSKVLAVLLEDGLRRLEAYPHDLNLQFHHVDSIEFLQSASQGQFDVIYLDPMHPERRSAAVSQELTSIRSLVGEDLDFTQLFELALSKAKKRVVLKWPIKAQTNLPNANFSYSGRAIRYDCFLPT